MHVRVRDLSTTCVAGKIEEQISSLETLELPDIMKSTSLIRRGEKIERVIGLTQVFLAGAPW